VTKGTVWKEIPLGLLAALLIGFMANDFLIDGKNFSSLTRIDGLVLLSFFIIFMYYTFGIGKSNGANHEEVHVKSYKLWKSILLVLAGLITLTLGGKLIVDNAVALATALGVSASLIGLTVVAFGTSVPELATSVVAAYKKNVDIAVGNVIGSNIFNLFWVLGVSSLISPLPFQMRSNIDILVVIFANLLLFAFMFVGKKRILEKSQGTMFIFLYAVYIAITIIQK
jgi:cation:H+ antiporter